MAKTLHFGNKTEYQKYLAYGHIHGVFTEKTRPKIFIAGKPHHVNHCEHCGSKTHHTFSHHLHHPHDRDSMKHSSRRKSSGSGVLTPQHDSNNIHAPRITIPGKIGLLPGNKSGKNGVGVTNIHSHGIKLPKVDIRL